MTRGRPLLRAPLVVVAAVLLVSASMLACAPSLAETRLALVISNASYPSEIGRLDNPHKDGATIAAALQGVGFDKANITILKDADQPTLRLAVADFVERIEKAGSDAVVFLYYSGHGAADRTDRGENYLIPIGARITLARQLPILGVGLSEVTKALERVPAKARFVVIDACRNVAFTKGLKDATKGFVPERKLDGMIVAFATRPGETADDNNIYASALASVLPTPGLRAEEVFKETQLKVAELSRGQQVPWTEDGLLTRFKFKEKAPEAKVTPTSPAPQVAIVAPPPPARCPGIEVDVVGQGNTCLDPADASRREFADCTGRGGGWLCGPAMVVVSAGNFTMGSPWSEADLRSDEGPQRVVTIAKPFAVGKFEVTFAEWDACVVDGGCKTKPGDEGWGRGKRPVINVSWNDITGEYLPWLNGKLGLKGAGAYRLLTEAEWEYVARAGTTTPFSTGPTITTEQANFNGDYTYGGSTKGAYRQKTVDVGTFKPNAFGLHDMHGNVREWVEDCWHDSYNYAPGDGTSWSTACADTRRRGVRGGSWGNHPQDLRSAGRLWLTTVARGNFLGFRVARFVSR